MGESGRGRPRVPLGSTGAASAQHSEGSTNLEVSVVICAYSLGRWVDLQRAVASVLSQVAPVHEIVVVIDHNARLLAQARALWPAERSIGDRSAACPVIVTPSAGAPGLSGARNTGVRVAAAGIVAFLDDDATAEEGWLQALVEHFSEPNVVACGGAVLAAPLERRPSWWPLEFDWVVGCSYRGLPTMVATVRNPIGASMAVRRSAVIELGGFAEGVGRLGSRPVGCEETDLFIRLRQRWPEARIVYEPASRVRHTVPPARLSWRYFRSRCFAEGLSKASVAGRVGQTDALASERSYVARVLPSALARAAIGACRGEDGAAQRGLAIGAGVALTAVGYLCGRLRPVPGPDSTSLPLAIGSGEHSRVTRGAQSEPGPWRLPLGACGPTE